MAITYTDNGGGAPNGSDLEFTFTFPVIQTEDVKVALNNVVQATTKYAVDTASNPTKITFNNTSIDATVQESTGAPKTGVTVRVFRQTQVGKSTGDDDPKAVYASGSSIRAVDLNANTEQALYAIHELQDQPLTDADIEDGSITSDKIADGTIANVDVSSTAAIDGTKISPDFGSQNIATTGTINNLTTTELAILDGATVSTAELNTLDGVTASTAELNLLDGVTSTTAELNILDGVTATTAEINKLDGVTASTAELNILDGVTASTAEINKLDGVTATTAEINHVDGVTSAIQTQLDGKQPLDSELTELATMGSGTAGALADLNTAEVQTLDGITASTTELNLLDGKSIVTSITGSATDVQIPSAQAVNERIVELVTEVGGFAPIANETSFPATNPDINDGAGTIVSIKALASNLVANSSGVATIANGAGTGNTVTINGLGNAQTITAGKGLLVETTTTLHTYTFHREAIDGTGITNASNLVSDFNDRYQISASAPSSHPDGSALQDGDLWFDTAANIMKVYDLGNTQYDAVTSVGDFKLLTVVPDGATSGSPTFNGNIVSYDLRDGTNAAAITSVGQLLVSLNGVIQKPNDGTYNASNEGFYLEGTNGIKFCTAPPSGSSLFITLIGAATAIGTPSDNTVNENKLTSDSVSEAKLKVSNSPVDGYFLSAQSGNTGGLTWAQGNFLPLTGGTVTGLLSAFGGIQLAQNDTIEFDTDNTNIFKITFKGPNTLTKNSNYTLPEDGSANHYLTTNGSGVLSFGALNASHLTGALPAISGANLTDIDAGATGTGNDKIFWENGKTVTQSYTIGTTFGAACNAMSAGPITINNNVVVTVGSGNTWTIV